MTEVKRLFKLLGAVILTMSSGLAGMSVASIYAKRPRQLRQMQAALKILQTEISYTLSPLPEALNNVCSRSVKEIAHFFKRAGGELAGLKTTSAREAWERACEELGRSASLTEADLSVIRELGKVIGISDREDQISHLQLALDQLQLQIADADEAAHRNVKMWNYLGFLGGLALSLMLY